MTRKEFIRFVALMRNPKYREVAPDMCLERYLGTVAIAYSSIFDDPNWLGSMSFHMGSKLGLLRYKGITPGTLPTCCPRDQYRALADGRHGGLLDLPPHDPEAFSLWYSSDARTGQHPFEILAGDQAHGILLRVDLVGDGRQGWDYELSVYVPGFYAMAVRKALALDRARIPFAVRDYERVIGGLVLRRERRP